MTDLAPHALNQRSTGTSTKLAQGKTGQTAGFYIMDHHQTTNDSYPFMSYLYAWLFSLMCTLQLFLPVIYFNKVAGIAHGEGDNVLQKSPSCSSNQSH